MKYILIKGIKETNPHIVNDRSELAYWLIIECLIHSEKKVKIPKIV